MFPMDQISATEKRGQAEITSDPKQEDCLERQTDATCLWWQTTSPRKLRNFMPPAGEPHELSLYGQTIPEELAKFSDKASLKHA